MYFVAYAILTMQDAWAWDGVDPDTGDAVTIGEQVRTGTDIECMMWPLPSIEPARGIYLPMRLHCAATNSR